MNMKAAGESVQTGFWWGLGFTVAFVLIQFLMNILFNFRIGLP